MPVEETVEIQEVIPTTVVMLVAVFPVSFIPDRLNVREGRGFGLIHPVNQPDVHFLTVAHPLRLNL